ncbi:hypothetical protein AGIG_G21566 [Arapaima gigas]
MIIVRCSSQLWRLRSVFLLLSTGKPLVHAAPVSTTSRPAGMCPTPCEQQQYGRTLLRQKSTCHLKRTGWSAGGDVTSVSSTLLLTCEKALSVTPAAVLQNGQCAGLPPRAPNQTSQEAALCPWGGSHVTGSSNPLRK